MKKYFHEIKAAVELQSGMIVTLPHVNTDYSNILSLEKLNIDTLEKRPALIYSTAELDVVYFKISEKKHPPFIPLNESSFLCGSTKEVSFIHTDKLFTIHQKLVGVILGIIQPRIFNMAAKDFLRGIVNYPELTIDKNKVAHSLDEFKPKNRSKSKMNQS